MEKELLKEKLRKLDTSAKSIESVSRWCKFYRKEYKGIVEVWYQELYQANTALKMSLLYLANDIIQTSRKDGKEFPEEFYKYLPKVLVHVNQGKDEKVKSSVRRLLEIWDNRKVFGNTGIQSLISKTNFPYKGASASAGAPSPSKRPRDPREGPRDPREVRKETQRDVQRHVQRDVQSMATAGAGEESKEFQSARTLGKKIHQEAEELSLFERQNREALSTSEIVSGSSSDKVLDRYQNLIWKAMQSEKSLVSLLEDWKGKVEESILKKEESVKQLKKDLLKRNTTKEGGEQQGQAKASSKQVAEKLLELGSENAEALLKNFFALKGMPDAEKQNNNNSAPSPGNTSKRMRSEL